MQIPPAPKRSLAARWHRHKKRVVPIMIAFACVVAAFLILVGLVFWMASC